MRSYFVASFALMAVLGAALTANWWYTIPEEWWPVRLGFAVFGLGVTLFSVVMVLVAATTRYRQP
jgi:hypothetical protein